MILCDFSVYLCERCRPWLTTKPSLMRWPSLQWRWNRMTTRYNTNTRREATGVKVRALGGAWHLKTFQNSLLKYVHFERLTVASMYSKSAEMLGIIFSVVTSSLSDTQGWDSKIGKNLANSDNLFCNFRFRTSVMWERRTEVQCA